MILGVEGLRRTVRRFRDALAPSALILLYHRVTELPSDPHLLCVTPEHFGEHLEILRKYGRPLQVQRLAQALGQEKLPRGAIVVTFDDGYADNLSHAEPLLARYDIPATIFVTTGYLGRDREFWWDELERLLLQPGVLPETLRLSVNGITYQWELREAAHYSEDSYRRHRSWTVLETDEPSQRYTLYRTLHQLLRPLPQAARLKALDDLVAWAGAESKARETHRALLLDEVAHLAHGGLLEVGAHTVTHPILAALPTVAQRAEIQQSKAQLEEMLGKPVTSFAYPFGSRLDYTAETVTLVRNTGFACACSNFPGVVGRRAALHELPRVMIRDCDGDTFAMHLREFFNG